MSTFTSPVLAEKIKQRWSRFVEERHVDWTWRVLEALYTEPHRRYHTLAHIAACLNWFDQFEQAERPSSHCLPIRLALLFHDAVYVPGDKRNESLSADLLRAFTPIMGLTDGTIEQAIVAVLATRRRETVADDTVSQLVVDIDMAILGTEPYVYDSYVSAVRREFAAVSDDAWRVGRAGFLAGMLERERIYQTSWGRGRFEKFARDNMRRELASLGGPR